MNGDTIDRITRFLEGEQEGLPSRVSNGMILIAIKEERDSRKEEMKEVLDKVNKLIIILNGKEPDGSDGLIHRVEGVERFRNLAGWVLSSIALAFLGGLGMYIFNKLFD